jgi:hypothetical protein
MDDIESHVSVKLERKAGRLPLPGVVVALETNHAQMFESIPCDSKLERVKVYPAGDVVVRESATEAGNRRRIGDSPDLVLAGRGHHGPIAHLIFGAPAWFACPDRDQNPHDLSIEPWLSRAGRDLSSFRARPRGTAGIRKRSGD